MNVELQKTPYYLLDEAKCVNRTQKIKEEIAAWGGRICYAIKAKNNKKLVNLDNSVLLFLKI